MRTLRAIICLCLAVYGSLNAYSQTDDNIYSFVEVMPQFPGGEDSLIKFLSRTLKYPEKEMMEEVQGKVFVQFVIDEEGKASSPRVLRGVSEGLDKEALRVIPLLPPFTPGMQQGKAVKVYYNLPVSFKLGIKYHPNAPVVFDTAVKSNTVLVDGEMVYGFTDIPSAFPGGDKALIRYVSVNTKYPYEELSSGKEGSVHVRFIVNREGYVVKPVVIKSDYVGFNEEAIRVVSTLPKFSPGKKANGEPVLSFFTVPVTFRIPINEIVGVLDEDKYDEVAKFPGGDIELIRFLQENIVYPELEKENDISGSVIVAFEVYSSGELGNTRVVKSSGYAGLDSEALRVAKLLPKFKPSYNDGKPVQSTFYFPVEFVFHEISPNNGNYPIGDKLINAKESLNKPDEYGIYAFTDIPAKYPGGDEKLVKTLQSNIIYPESEKKMKIEGKVMLRFVINEQGKVTEPTVVRGVSSGLDAEALRVVQTLSDFIPGKKADGTPVRCYFSLPVVFKL